MTLGYYKMASLSALLQIKNWFKLDSALIVVNISGVLFSFYTV